MGMGLTLVLVLALTPFLATRLRRSKVFPGYTLVAPLFSTKTDLIDMEGRLVRRWQSDYTAGQTAYLLENGHLLRAGQLRSRWPGSGVHLGR